MYGRNQALPIFLAAAFAVLASISAPADVVICNDGSRHEGEVSEKGGQVVVKTKKGVVKLKAGDVFEILRTETSLVDRFRANPAARDLLLLASRAGRRMKLADAEKIVKELRSREDVTVEALIMLDGLHLTPEYTRRIVERQLAEFRKKFGDEAAVYQGEHYVVLTPLGGFWARKVGLRMDGIFKEYEKRLVFKEKVTDRFVVKVFRSREEYSAHGGMPGSAAYFCSGTRELVAYRQPSEDQLFECLYHEGMHQFLHFHVPNPPIWFDEGLAQYFETARPKFVSSGEEPSYDVGRVKRGALDYFRRSLGRGSTVPLRSLIAMSRAEFYGSRRSLCYAEAWALTHFLVESEDRRLKQLWFDYFFAVRDGTAQEEVNRKVFGRVNLEQLEKTLKKYVERLR